jgi:hypothetical protein
VCCAGLVNTRLFDKMSFRYPFAIFTYVASIFMGLTAQQVCKLSAQSA